MLASDGLRLSIRRSTVVVAIAALMAAGMIGASAVPSIAATVNGPNGIALTVTPTLVSDLTNEVTLQVSGTGYSTTKNNGFGVYVSFGPQPTGPRAGNSAFTDATRYYDGGPGHGTIWVRNGTPSGPGQAQLESDGTFAISLSAKASYTGADSNVYDSDDQQLGVLTYAAHGTEASASDADSQYVFVPVTFAVAPSAPGAPTASGDSPTSAAVSWVEPDDGGSPITGYTATIYNGTSASSVAATATVGNVTSTTVPGLAADTSYNAKVAATNAAGSGPQSVRSSIFRTPPTPVGETHSGLLWKISHQAWTSSSLNGHELVAPATKTTDGFVFTPAGDGTFDPATGEAAADFLGTASIGNTSQGGYRIFFADPSIEVDDAGEGILSADISYRTSLVGPVSTPTRVTVATFDVDPGDIQDAGDHVVLSVTLDGTFTAEFINHLHADLRGHFQATGSASDPLKAPSPLSAGFDVFGCATSPFTDVPTSHPFCAEIQWMKDEGISTGFEDGSYQPSIDVTRQAMSAFMARLADATLSECATQPFTDVPASHPFCSEIQWMKDSGISTGFGDGSYQPDLDVTRQAMSAFMARLAGATLSPCSTAPFTDVPTSHPFCSEIQWMKDSGISTGFGDGSYQPSIDVTRQAMSAFMHRVSSLLP